MKALVHLIKASIKYTLPLTFAFIAGCDVTDNTTKKAGSDTDQTADEQESDPVVVDYPIAYIERPTPYETDNDSGERQIVPFNVFDPSTFNPGARLLIKARASVSASAKVITANVFPAQETEDGETIQPRYDIKDLSVNADGTKLVFSMRAPEIEDADDDEQPTWNIWEYDVATDTLTRVIASDIRAEAGQDVMPVYLPDDRIVFSSTRQRASKSILLDQNRPQYTYVTERDRGQYAYTLHVIDEDRENIEQISFGVGQDLYPTVLADGRILFLRGDATSNTNRDRLSLYTINPDGSNLSMYYGYYSPSSSPEEGQGMLSKPIQMPDGRILVTYQLRENEAYGGDIVAVDGQNYTDLTTPTYSNVGGEGPAEASVSFGDVIINGQSPHGIFNSAKPLFDNTGRYLVSWQPCLVQGYNFGKGIYTRSNPASDGTRTYTLINTAGQLVDKEGDVLTDGEAAVVIAEEDMSSLPCTNATFDNENIELADPQFGVWIYDPLEETHAPVVIANTPSIMYTEAVVFAARTTPTYIPGFSGIDDRDELIDENVGVINIRSIYSFDGSDSTDIGIAALADPLQTPIDTHAVRFIRLWEQAKYPENNDFDIDNALVGGRNNRPGRSILGYARVHPDGSAQFKVPANVAFTMEWVDAKGRRVLGNLSGQHNNWLNVVPGEIRTCNGCHSANSSAPHGRYEAEPPSANIGALTTANFPNTRLTDAFGTAYSLLPDVGETMAEYYTRARLADPSAEDPRNLSLDIVFSDDWTNPDSGATVGADIRYQYGVAEFATADNLHTPAPVLISDCLEEWRPICRITIDYPDHIQPIWEAPRSIDVNGTTQDITCTNCHSSVDPDGNPQIPEPVNTYQLSFENSISPLDNNMVFLKSYDELFATGDPVLALIEDTGQIGILLVPQIIDGEIQYEMTQATNEQGTPLFEAIDQSTNSSTCAPEASASATIILNLDEDGNTIPCITYVYQTDENGNLVLDGAGNPIPQPILIPDTQDRYLSVNQGANTPSNQKFFNVFESGGAHAGYLNNAELKLISEYLDIGGQYYNEIFKALDD